MGQDPRPAHPGSPPHCYRRPVPTLEVIALNAEDARRAEAGGADRIELLGTMAEDGLSPDPRAVERARAAVSLEIRVMLRLSAGFQCDDGEARLLAQLASDYASAGADGVVLGFLDHAGEVDLSAVADLEGDGQIPWTFHRAIDHARDPDAAWRAISTLPGLTQVLTAGSSHGVGQGLASLVTRAESDPAEARLIMAGGGLAPDYLPALAAAGIGAFHIGSPARPDRSFAEPVDPQRVARWRSLVDGAAAPIP